MSISRKKRSYTTTVKLSALAAATLAGAGLLGGCARGPADAALTGTVRPAATPPSAMPASAVLKGTLAALRSGGSVHLAETGTDAQGTWTLADDSTPHSGMQAFTTPGGGHGVIVLISGVGYIQANAVGLEKEFDVPSATAKRYAGRWISLRPGQALGVGDYASVTTGITLNSMASDFAVSAPKKLAAGRFNGQPVVGVEGALTAAALLPAGSREALYAADNAGLRPVMLKITVPGESKSRGTFSKWHEQVHLPRPVNVISASVVTPSASAV